MGDMYSVLSIKYLSKLDPSVYTHPAIKIIENTPSRMHTNSNALLSFFFYLIGEEFVAVLDMYNDYLYICAWCASVYFDFNVALECCVRFHWAKAIQSTLCMCP